MERFVLLHSFGVVQAQRTSSNLLEPQKHSDSKVWRGLSNEFDGFDCTEPSLSTVLQGGAFCPMSSGWFNCTEPSLTTMLQGKQGVQGS